MDFLLGRVPCEGNAPVEALRGDAMAGPAFKFLKPWAAVEKPRPWKHTKIQPKPTSSTYCNHQTTEKNDHYILIQHNIPAPSKGCLLVVFEYLKAFKKHPVEGAGKNRISLPLQEPRATLLAGLDLPQAEAYVEKMTSQLIPKKGPKLPNITRSSQNQQAPLKPL